MGYHTSEDFTEIHTKVQAFVKDELEPIALQVERDGQIPEAIVSKMCRLGLFGISIPKHYGGLGLSTCEEILLYEEMARTKACFRSRIGTNNGIGSMGILFDGTEDQKKKYLPRIASGEWTAAFALTEPNAGSDAANISTSAAAEGEYWILNGSKQFITNADCAHVFTTIAVTDPAKGARGGFTAFIIEKDMPGFRMGVADKKMGMRGSQTHELVFKDCIVPRDNVIGGNDMIGQGFKTAMRVLDKGRLTMGACALGAAKKMLEISIEHVRKQLKAGKPADDLQATQFALADMATAIYAAEQMLYHTAKLRDEGNQVVHEASMVKVFCTEAASRIADMTMDIFGQEGYLTKHQVEGFLRDIRLYRIFEGTSEIQRLIISRNLLKKK